MKPSTEQDYRRRIARVVEAILIDPAAPHTVESLAAVAHLSSFHFHRIYRAITGESVAMTVRRVRLARAAHQLAWSADSVTSIALDVGYDSPQTFARAFRSFTGVSPSEFLEQQRDLMPQGMDAAAAAVQLCELPSMDVLCLRHQDAIAGIAHTYCALHRALDALPSACAPREDVGISYGDPHEENGFAYFAGVRRSETMPATPAAPIETRHIEGGLYAAYRLVGPYALIAPSFETLFGRWLARSGYEPDHRPALELYRSPTAAAAAAAQSGCVTDLLIPIRKECR